MRAAPCAPHIELTALHHAVAVHRGLGHPYLIAQSGNYARVIATAGPSGHTDTAADDSLGAIGRTDDCPGLRGAAVLGSQKQRLTLAVDSALHNDADILVSLGRFQATPFAGTLERLGHREHRSFPGAGAFVVTLRGRNIYISGI